MIKVERSFEIRHRGWNLSWILIKYMESRMENNMKKVIIIGAGIAGLSAGIFARKCGFDVTILESHCTAGGNCTSWKRKGYLFEGGMHWLVGSNPQNPLNQLWRTIGALNDEVTIHCNEPFLEFDHDGTPIRLFRDVDATENHLLKLSPADAAEIKKLCGNIRKVQAELEVDSDCYELSREAYAKKFSHQGIRELIRSLPGDDQGILMLIFTLGSLIEGDGGFPEGGSRPFVDRIVKTFTSLGGTIQYNTPVDRVIVEQGKATGIISGGRQLAADAVIITADTMSTDKLFVQPLDAPWLDEMRTITGPTIVTFVSLGINADLKQYPERLIFKPAEPVCLADQTYEYLSLSSYARDPNYSPDGKTAITIQLPGDTYDFWKKFKEEGRYAEEKQSIARQIMTMIAQQIPEADGRIEVCDIATPLTYERYCGNWKGSWMTEMKAGMRMEPYPNTIAGLKGVYFAGQRMMPPGGLPPALLTGRAAVEQLCHDTDTIFFDEV